MPQSTKILLLIFLLVTVAVAWFIASNTLQDEISIERPDESVVEVVEPEEYVLVTEEGVVASLSYTTEGKDVAILRINGETYELKRVVSGSGARYANEDESVVYWEHQGEATIEFAQGATYIVSTIEQAELVTFTIAPEKVDCVGLGPMKCMVVNGGLFYESIEGFEFEEGTEYEILVARTERENVPQDASIYEYRQVEVLRSNKIDVPEDGSIFIESEPVFTEDEMSVVNDEDLFGDTWLWKETQYSNGEVVAPADSARFAAQFTADGLFSSSTDCNAIRGSYAITGNNLSFGNLLSTLMACMDETKEAEYANMLAEVVSYTIDGSGNLVLMLGSDAGFMIFTPW